MKFTESHEWIVVEEEVGVVGITEHAQRELGEIVYVELPQVGKVVRAGEEVAVLESTKAAADVYSPVSGEVVAVNEELLKQVRLINTAAEEGGWLFQIRPADPTELDNLLTEEEYKALVKI